MTRERLTGFAADLNRLGPLAIVSLATAVCLPSLLEFFSGRLAIGSMLGRYCLALLFATVAVRTVSWVVLRYAVKNAAEAELGGVQHDQDSAPVPHRSSDRASERRN